MSRVFRSWSDVSLEARVGYRAAGVLPIVKARNGDSWLLLGQEKRRHSVVWSDFGGKREDDDASAEHTALRECTEEIPFLSGESLARDGPVVWNDGGRYLMFVRTTTLQRVVSRAKTMRDEKTDFAFVAARDLYAKLDTMCKLDQLRNMAAFVAVDSNAPNTECSAQQQPDMRVDVFRFFASSLVIPGVRECLIRQ